MTHPTDDDQHPALPRHTTDAEIGDAMTKQVAMLKSADALIHHLHHSSVVDNVDRQTIADIVALLRACKGGASPDAWQEGWRAGLEAAAKVAEDARTRNTVYEKARRDAAAAIRALAEKGPNND